jgi:hypothetical protein
MATGAFHERRFLKNARITNTLSFDYQDFLADFSGVFSYLTTKAFFIALTAPLGGFPASPARLPANRWARLSECLNLEPGDDKWPG